MKNVSKCYAGKFALDNVNLAVYEKKITAVTGESGCGKSTLAKVLVGLESHDTGSIMYKGKPMATVGAVGKKERKEFRKNNQVMFQNPLLSVNPSFKIGKIRREPLLINTRGRMTGRVNKQEINLKIGGFLEMLEIPGGLLDRYPLELSGGQLQRVVLARALVLEPEFIVLDEPFSSLDEIMAARLAEMKEMDAPLVNM